jgi:hypothetical protein
MGGAVAVPIVQLRSVCKAASVSASTPLQLLPEDKLDVLRYLDEFHYWHSLDDKRRCKRCGRIITGRQMIVIELQGRRGKLHLQCPTVACISTPSDWVYADPILAAKLRAAFRPAASHAGLDAIAAQRARDGHADKVRPAKQVQNKNSARARVLEPVRPFISFRALAARSKLLRTIASGLHAIRPVA